GVGEMRLGVLCAVAAAIALGVAAGASAIINGQPDGNGHPYVGIVTNGPFVCSGAAISPRVFVTAAHCFDVPGEAVQVSFDPGGFTSGATVVSGKWYPEPGFCTRCDHGLPGFDTNDVAVVVLDEAVSLPRYGQLPAEGSIDSLPKQTPLTVV